MGGKCPHRKVKKRRYSHKQFRRDKFQIKGDDAVYDELKKITDPDSKPKPPLPLDEDLPGMGQFYCLHCDRYFANVTVRDEHFKTKKHRKRYVFLLPFFITSQFSYCFVFYFHVVPIQLPVMKR